MKERSVRVTLCADCTDACLDNQQFCKYIVTGDGPSCFGTILKPNLRARSAEEENLYRGPKSFPCGTRILINLLRNIERSTMNFLPEWTKVKRELYVKVLEMSLKGISRVRAQIREKGTWFLSLDNALLILPWQWGPANASAETSQQHYTTDIALAGLSYSLRWKSPSVEHFRTLRT